MLRMSSAARECDDIDFKLVSRNKLSALAPFLRRRVGERAEAHNVIDFYCSQVGPPRSLIEMFVMTSRRSQRRACTAHRTGAIPLSSRATRQSRVCLFASQHVTRRLMHALSSNRVIGIKLTGYRYEKMAISMQSGGLSIDLGCKVPSEDAERAKSSANRSWFCCEPRRDGMPSHCRWISPVTSHFGRHWLP
jgi:hypothetical protein